MAREHDAGHHAFLRRVVGVPSVKGGDHADSVACSGERDAGDSKSKGLDLAHPDECEGVDRYRDGSGQLDTQSRRDLHSNKVAESHSKAAERYHEAGLSHRNIGINTAEI